MAQQDSFQAAIDYLIQNKQKPVFNEQGVFTQTAPETKPSVMSNLFGDEFLLKQKDRGNGFDPAAVSTGNPYSGRSLFDAPTFDDVASGLARQGAFERNKEALARGGGFIGNLFQMALPGAMFAQHVLPRINNQINDWQYTRALDDYDARAANAASAQGLGGVGTYSDAYGRLGTMSNQEMIDAYDRDMFGITGSEMNAARGTDYGSMGVSDGFGYSGSDSDYGQSGAATDRD
jgi:hypothetical protein